MRYWHSPFQWSDGITTRLQEQGLIRWRGTMADVPSDAVLLYDTPDRLWGHAADCLAKGYRQLSDAAARYSVQAAWRLLKQEPAAGAMERALTYALLAAVPEVLQAYLDLELRADLQDDQPDVDYSQRLIASIAAEPLLAAWHELQQSGTDTLEEIELTLLQLHQVQEELEHYFLLSRAQKGLLGQYQHLASNLLASLKPAAAQP
jgi:hypothetical protein